MGARKEDRKTVQKKTAASPRSSSAATGHFVTTGRTSTTRPVPVRGVRSRSYTHAENIRKKIGFTQQEFAGLLGIDPRTYTRRGEDEVLKSGESLQVEMLEEVLQEATRVFRGEELARKWLHSPIIGLDNKRPIDHLDSIQGYERIKDALGKIEFGMY